MVSLLLIDRHELPKVYNASMPITKKTSKSKKTGKKNMKVHLMPADDRTSKDGSEDEFGESGMFLAKEDVQLIYNALAAYTPTELEGLLHSTLLEWFEEILVVDYGEPYPDAN